MFQLQIDKGLSTNEFQISLLKHVLAIFMELKMEMNVPMIPLDSVDANLELLVLIATNVRMVIGVSERILK